MRESVRLTPSRGESVSRCCPCTSTRCSSSRSASSCAVSSTGSVFDDEVLRPAASLSGGRPTLRCTVDVQTCMIDFPAEGETSQNAANRSEQDLFGRPLESGRPPSWTRRARGAAGPAWYTTRARPDHHSLVGTVNGIGSFTSPLKLPVVVVSGAQPLPAVAGIVRVE